MQGDMLKLSDIFAGLDSGRITLTDESSGESAVLSCSFSERQKEILCAGGLLSYTKTCGGK